MKLLIVALSTIVLSGCTYQSVNSWDIERAIKACGGIDNVVSIDATFLGDEFVDCKNNKDMISLQKVLK